MISFVVWVIAKEKKKLSTNYKGEGDCAGGFRGEVGWKIK
jgi:hypothetical protein